MAHALNLRCCPWTSDISPRHIFPRNPIYNHSITTIKSKAPPLDPDPNSLAAGISKQGLGATVLRAPATYPRLVNHLGPIIAYICPCIIPYVNKCVCIVDCEYLVMRFMGSCVFPGRGYGSPPEPSNLNPRLLNPKPLNAKPPDPEP